MNNVTKNKEIEDRERDAKLVQLRRDIQDGFLSGDVTTWNPNEAKREGRKRRKAQQQHD